MRRAICSIHNLICPEGMQGIMISQPRHAKGGKVLYAKEKGGMLLFCCDNKNAWEQGLFEVNTRSVFSPVPEVFVLVDEIRTAQALKLHFYLNSIHEIKRMGETYEILGSKSKLRVIPLGWYSRDVHIGREGTDELLNPVNVLRISPTVSDSYRLITILEVASYTVKEQNPWEILNKEEQYTIGNGKVEICFSCCSTWCHKKMRINNKNMYKNPSVTRISRNGYFVMLSN